MASRIKEPDATNCWKGFVAIIKKISKLSTYFIKIPNNILYLNGTEFSESVVYITNPKYQNFYTWLACDIDDFLNKMKVYDIKVNGTSIVDDTDKVRVYKNSALAYMLDKLNQPLEDRKRIANSNYKRIVPFIPSLIDDNNWEQIPEDVMTDIIDNKVTIMRQMHGTPMTLSKGIFPMLKTSAFTYVKYLGEDRDNGKMFVGIKEECTEFNVYTLRAIMILNEDE